jgi:uncharacterized protein YkwD
MKNIIVILFTLLSVNSFSQTREGLIAVSNRNVTKYVEPKPIIFDKPGTETRKSYIDPQNINKKLIEDLLLEKCNIERKKNNSPNLVSHPSCSLASQHHSDYMSFYDTLGHDEPINGFKGHNIKSVWGDKFVTPEDRLEYFHSFKKDDPQDLLFLGEICQSSPTFGFLKSNERNTETYESFTEKVIQSWKGSPKHYKNMCDNLSDYGYFTFSTNKSGTKLSGVFAMCYNCMK